MNKKILIIYATYGSGHKTVANYLYESLKNDYNVEIIDILDYDNIELYEYQSKSYALCHNDNCDDLHLFVLQEYDLINNEFTKKYWNNKYGDKYESYTLGCNWIRSFNKKIGKC